MEWVLIFILGSGAYYQVPGLFPDRPACMAAAEEARWRSDRYAKDERPLIDTAPAACIKTGSYR